MKTIWISLVLMSVLSSFAAEQTNFQVRVVASDVNVRVRPDAGTEVVVQVQEGQLLSVARVDGDWLGVLAPTNAGLWVKKQFVKGGIVTGDKIRLRSGPGISYRDVGTVVQGAALTELETHGEWLKVAAPSDLILWISRSVVQPFETASAQVAAEISKASGSTLTHDAVVAATPQSRELPAGLSRNDLAAVLGQGSLVERSGKVERVPLAFLRSMDYRLVTLRNDQKVTLCYLRGNQAQMPSLVGRRLTVKGREYWLNNQRYPVVYPELITPLAE